MISAAVRVMAGDDARADLFSIQAVEAAGGPVLTIETDREGAPTGASVARIVEATPERVWEVVEDVASYSKNVPMLEKVERDGDRVKASLRFKIAIVSVRFHFEAIAEWEDAKWLELRHVAGEPRDLRIRFDFKQAGPGRTLLVTKSAFDVMSLGWLVKIFLRHHPEIRYGVMPGTALVLSDGIARIAEGRPPLGAKT